MKRKILGLTMQFDRVYNNKHQYIYDKYTFLNPVTTQVLNMIIDELAQKYQAVKGNNINDIPFGHKSDIHTGFLIAQTREQFLNNC